MSLTLLPSYQKEHVLVFIPRPWKCDQESKKVSDNFNQDVTVAKEETLCGDEYDGLLGHGMRLAGRKA
jgi:hypothetical protein